VGSGIGLGTCARAGCIGGAVCVASFFVAELTLGAGVRVKGGGTFQACWAGTVEDALASGPGHTRLAGRAGAVGLGDPKVVALPVLDD
jgi:hypothetical protein